MGFRGVFWRALGGGRSRYNGFDREHLSKHLLGFQH